MLISVVIVSWNAKAFLLKCLESVLAQSGHHQIEIIVVDNASSDGSPEAVSEQFPGVKVIRNDQNYGFSRANNIGIRASRGDYLFLINSDVVVSPGCFDRMLEFMAEHPEIGILGPRIVGADGRLQRSCMRYPSLSRAFARALALDSLFPNSRLFGSHLLSVGEHDSTKQVDVINGCFWLVRRQAMDQVGLLDEMFLIYGEDIDWCRRFTASGWQVVFFPEAEALHYGGASSANAPVKFYLEMQLANHQYCVKHHSRAACRAFLVINVLHHAVRCAGEVFAIPFSARRRRSARFKIERNLASIAWGLRTLTSPLWSSELQPVRRSL